uniref:LIM zinc-binding domain-containing protein n=1 Tax=Rhabditophanes sp. KR3021 TaxID=114890 RepID=A0AC35U5E3_9BILA
MGRHPMAQTNNLGSGKKLESNYSSKSVTKSNEERKVISPYGNNGPECVVSKTKSPLPHDIRQATSKAFSKSEGLPNWPPSESSLNCPNKYWSIHLAPTPPKESKSLLDLVNESDCESRGNSRVNSNYPSPYPSPRICTQISPIPKAMQAKNNISNETPSPSVTPRLTKLAGTKEESSKNNDVGANYLSKLPEITTTLVKNDSCLLDVPKSEKQIRWVETPEIIEETDIITEESLSDYRPNGEDDRYDDIEADESDCLDEQEKWIREELEQYRQEKEMEKEIEKETIRQLSEEYDLNLEKDDINIETKSEYVLESITKHQLNLKSQQHKLATLMANAMNLLKNIENSPAFDNTVGNKINSTNQPHFQPHLQTNSRVIWAEQSLNAIEQINEQFEEKINYLNSMNVAKSTFEHQPNISSFCEYESLKNEVPHKTELELLQDDSPQVRLSQLLNEITDQTQYLPRHNFGVNDDNMAANYNQQSQARNLNNTTFDSHDYGKQQHLVNKVTKTTTTTTNSYPSGNQSNNAYENRVPYCGQCKSEIRGAFVMTGGLTYCPEHFICANASCSRKLVDVGFVEEKGKRFCEGCFEKLIAPVCNKCAKPVTGDCLNALQKQWHPTCFACAHCLKPFGNTAFYMENGKPYCEVDWNNLFTTKCVSCKFPIEAGDRWVEALGASFHSNCFSCMACHVNLEGQSFYAKNGQPYCKLHA